MIVTYESIAEQLVEIYNHHEWWVLEQDKLPHDVILKYYLKLLKQGNIIIAEFGGKVLGYVEFWKINFEQFGRIVCHADFFGDKENIQDGNIAYVANVWITPSFRSSWVTKVLKIKFYQHTHMCDYYTGMATRKKTQPIKVFKKSELTSKLFVEGEM